MLPGVNAAPKTELAAARDSRTATNVRTAFMDSLLSGHQRAPSLALLTRPGTMMTGMMKLEWSIEKIGLGLIYNKAGRGGTKKCGGRSEEGGWDDSDGHGERKLPSRFV